MDLIERYIYEVKRFLPESIREDVALELRTNIEDMLPNDYTKDDVYEVLMKLGSPSELANEYNSQKRYLIGPAYYDRYIAMLRLVLTIVISVIIGVAILFWIIDSPEVWYEASNIAKLFENLVSSIVLGALQAAFWVTISFIILERSGVDSGDIPFFKKIWTPEDLPKTTSFENIKISRWESLFSMIMSIIFTVILYLRPQLLAIYFVGESNNVEMTPLFNLNRISFYLNVIIIYALVQLGLFIWKYLKGRWNYPLAIIHSLYNLAVCLLLFVMIVDNSLINNEFF